jgi:imidazole glycerol-phosphate synthase subunit HisH
MIAIIDYGMGNPASIRNMLGRLGHRAELCKTPAEAGARGAERYILPGVGAFDEGMTRLADMGWAQHLRDVVAPERHPLLGICLGMQLLFERSGEGRLPGLGLVRGEVVRFDFSQHAAPVPRIPHMGWRHVTPRPAGASLFDGLEHEARFYFVHSYHCCCAEPSEGAAEASHGHVFTCAVRREALYGVQFHPEKSHRYGMRLLDNYARLPR